MPSTQGAEHLPPNSEPNTAHHATGHGLDSCRREIKANLAGERPRQMLQARDPGNTCRQAIQAKTAGERSRQILQAGDPEKICTHVIQANPPGAGSRRILQASDPHKSCRRAIQANSASERSRQNLQVNVYSKMNSPVKDLCDDQLQAAVEELRKH